MPQVSTPSGSIKPEALDPAISQAVECLVSCVKDIVFIREVLSPLLGQVQQRAASQAASGLPDPTLYSLVDQLVAWSERYARTAVNLTRVTDDASRLREFLSGGADSRPDLSSLSDAQLIEMIRSKVPSVAQE